MKQFYLFLLFAAAALMSFSAQGKTVTIKATANGAAYYVNPSNGSSVPLTTEGTEVTIERDGTMSIKTEAGWVITRVSSDNGHDFEYPDGTTDTANKGLVSYHFDNGSVITVYVEQGKVSEPTIWVYGEAGEYRVYYNGYHYPDAVGVISLVNDYSDLTVYAEEGYILTKVRVDNGLEPEIKGDGSYATCSTLYFPDSSMTVIDVETKAVSDIDTGIEAIEGVEGAEGTGAESFAGKAIYNLQGVRISADYSALPAGIYIVNGRKVRK